MRTFSIICASLLLASCGVLKDIENEIDDRLALEVSRYCDTVASNTIGNIERIKRRREIRQNGEFGPAGPINKPDGLDDKTAYGNGPVVVILCEGQEVPENLWKYFIRID